MYSYVRHLEARAFELFEECNDILISEHSFFAELCLSCPTRKALKLSYMLCLKD